MDIHATDADYKNNLHETDTSEQASLFVPKSITAEKLAEIKSLFHGNYFVVRLPMWGRI